MGQRPDPTPEVAGARIYAARCRIALALIGGALLALDPGAYPHVVAASIGFAVIGITGLVERFVRGSRWLGYEEALSCIAVVCMVGYNEGRVDVVSLLWLVAAVTGVLARGGRVGRVGPRDRGGRAVLAARDHRDDDHREPRPGGGLDHPSPGRGPDLTGDGRAAAAGSPRRRPRPPDGTSLGPGLPNAGGPAVRAGHRRAPGGRDRTRPGRVRLGEQAPWARRRGPAAGPRRQGDAVRPPWRRRARAPGRRRVRRAGVHRRSRARGRTADGGRVRGERGAVHRSRRRGPGARGRHRRGGPAGRRRRGPACVQALRRRSRDRVRRRPALRGGRRRPGGAGAAVPRRGPAHRGAADRGPGDRGRPTPTRRWPASPPAGARGRCTGSRSPTSWGCAPSWSWPACARR